MRRNCTDFAIQQNPKLIAIVRALYVTMAPLTTNGGDAGNLNLTASNMAVLKATLRNVKSLEVDWNGVMTEIGVNRAGNA